MKNLLFLTLISAILLSFYSCGEDTVNNGNEGTNTDFDIYLLKVRENPFKYSTYTIKMDGTGYKLFNDSLIVSTRSKQNRILLAKIDTNGMYISGIYYSESDGSNIVKIPTGNNLTDYFDLSPDAEKFLFTSNFNATLSIMNIDGTGQIILSNGITGNAFIPKFSPGGNLIAYLETSIGSVTGLYITNTTGTYKKLLKDSIFTVNGFNLDWSPDGSRILFQNRINNSNDPKICIIDTSGTAYSVITSGWESAWSPLGNKICLIDGASPDPLDLFLINPDGSEKTNISNNYSELEGNMQWSSDGLKILYTAQALGYPALLRIFDVNSNTTNIVIDSVDGAIWK